MEALCSDVDPAFQDAEMKYDDENVSAAFARSRLQGAIGAINTQREATAFVYINRQNT